MEMDPAGDMETFFPGLGHVRRTGRSQLMQIAVMHVAARDQGFFIAGPPIWVQRGLFTLLAPSGWARGYRARYAE